MPDVSVPLTALSDGPVFDEIIGNQEDVGVDEPTPSDTAEVLIVNATLCSLKEYRQERLAAVVDVLSASGVELLSVEDSEKCGVDVAFENPDESGLESVDVHRVDDSGVDVHVVFFLGGEIIIPPPGVGCTVADCLRQRALLSAGLVELIPVA